MSRARPLTTLIVIAALGGCRESPPPPQAAAVDPPPASRSAPRVDSTSRTRLRIVMEVHDHRHPLFTRAHAEAVADSVPEIDFVIVPRESVLAAIGTADAFVGPPTPELIGAASSRLRWVQTQGGGIEDALFPSLRDSPIVLTSAKIIKGPAMGDHAMALLLGLTREIWRGVESRRTEVWSNRHWKPVELHGKTALIVGLGGAGTQIAERAFASGMRVMAVDPKDIPMMRAVERLERVEALPDLLPLADVVFIAAPLTDRSVGMFDDRIFGLMKRGAYLINVSRGALVNTDALVRALRNGRLAGAGLDVIVPEPLPRGHPLWKMTNVILTPHLAGTSDIGATRRTQLVIENARRFARGLPLRNAVDKKLGY